MKRLLLPAGALVLVLTACGAGAKPAPRVAEVGARLSSVRVVAARRERAALREARTVLSEFVPPPGASAVQVPPGRYRSAHVLHESAGKQLAEVAEVHGFWSVRKPLKPVAAFVRAHPLRGFGGRGAEYGTNVPHFLRWGRSSPAGSPAPKRFLVVTAVALPRRTIIRVDVQIVWVYPRSPAEKVPSGTRGIVLRGYKLHKRVTDPAEVARIVRWFDALPVSPPGIVVACPLAAAAHTTLSFRGAGGAQLAQADVPLYPPANVCSPIGFAIGGKRHQPLVDSGRGPTFARRLERLLGLRLIHIHR